jgi:hypothetical protein
MSDNVVDFTTRLIKKECEKEEQAFFEMEEEERLVNELSLYLLSEVVETAAENGFDIRNNPECVKDLLLIMESIAGMMHRSVGDNLPITDISNKLFPYNEDRCDELLDIFLKNSGVFT